MIPNLTEEEVTKLKKAVGNEKEWNSLCDEIKKSRNGQYPPDWYEVIILGGIISGNIDISSTWEN